MIEIIVIITLWKKIGRMVEDRGHDNARTYQWLVPVMWFGGQIAGGFLGALSFATRGREPETWVLYLCGLLGAGIGMAILFGIIRGLPRRDRPEEADYTPRRRSSL